MESALRFCWLGFAAANMDVLEADALLAEGVRGLECAVAALPKKFAIDDFAAGFDPLEAVAAGEEIEDGVAVDVASVFAGGGALAVEDVDEEVGCLALNAEMVTSLLWMTL